MEILDCILEQLISNMRVEEVERQYRLKKVKKYMSKKHIKVYFVEY